MNKYEVIKVGAETGEKFESLAVAIAYFKNQCDRTKAANTKETWQLWQGTDQGIDGKLKYPHLLMEEKPMFMGDLGEDDVEILKMALPVYSRYMNGLIKKWRIEDGDGNGETEIAIEEAKHHRDRAIEILNMLVRR